MALALAASLHECDGLDETDLMDRFLAWRERGKYSCTGACFDIGITVSRALGRFKRTSDPVAGATDPMSAGNGSLIVLAPSRSGTGRMRRGAGTLPPARAEPRMVRQRPSMPVWPLLTCLPKRLLGALAMK